MVGITPRPKPHKPRLPRDARPRDAICTCRLPGIVCVGIHRHARAAAAGVLVAVHADEVGEAFVGDQKMADAIWSATIVDKK